MFEAGVRTSINKPLVIIAEHGTKLPFDTGGINTWNYDPELNTWTLQGEIPALAAHIAATSTSGNALWHHFGVHLQSAELTATSGTPEGRPP